MIKTFEHEIEMEFDNGNTCGYINVECNHETMAIVAMSVGDVGSEEGSYEDAIVEKKDLIKFLKKTLEMLEK
ncbi:hypothetical protein VP424E501_P0069 [Vibrio phage 424E50-1]|nr:hypothetical protein VP424E501_P0069 [Vibrio phage 424E50-1]